MDLIVLGYFIFWLVTVSRWKWKSHQTGTVLLSWPLATSCYLKGYSPVQNTSKNIPSLGLIERPSLSLDNNNDDIRNKSQTSFSHQTLPSQSFGFTPHISLSLDNTNIDYKDKLVKESLRWDMYYLDSLSMAVGLLPSFPHVTVNSFLPCTLHEWAHVKLLPGKLFSESDLCTLKLVESNHVQKWRIILSNSLVWSLHFVSRSFKEGWTCLVQRAGFGGC